MPASPRMAAPGVLLGAAFFLLAGCATMPAGGEHVTELCRAGDVRILAGFPAAGQHRCLVTGPAQVLLSVDPELAIDPPINPSPWYAFDIETDVPQTFGVTLDYGGYWHRYPPKIDRPGEDWQPLGAAAVAVTEDGHRARLSLELTAGRTRIAAQPVLAPADIAAWSHRFARQHGFRQLEYGRSREGRALQALVAGPEEADRLIVALTRQHPPEHSGGEAFEAFAQAIAAARENGALAACCRILLLPLVNPDGLARGHWRLGAGGIDLNRDWFAAGEPEIAAAQALIRAEAEGRRIEAFLDFHSTRQTLVYNPPAGTAAHGDALMAELAARYSDALDTPPDWVEGHNADIGTSKAWALTEFGFAGLTVELADESPQAEAHAIGRLTAGAVIAVVGCCFLPQRQLGKWADAQHRVEGALRSRRRRRDVRAKLHHSAAHCAAAPPSRR